MQNINLNIDNETITDDKVISNHFNKLYTIDYSRKICQEIAKTQLKPLIHT